MCLYSIELNLQRRRNGEFVGIGYKILPRKIFITGASGDIAIFNSKGQLTKAAEKEGWSRKWMKAIGRNRQGLQHEDASAYLSCNGQPRDYSPGFHIFLTKEAAKNYANCGVIVKVEYKNVIAFGTNEAIIGNSSAPCVVAEYMRVVEILS